MLDVFFSIANHKFTRHECLAIEDTFAAMHTHNRIRLDIASARVRPFIAAFTALAGLSRNEILLATPPDTQIDNTNFIHKHWTSRTQVYIDAKHFRIKIALILLDYTNIFANETKWKIADNVPTIFIFPDVHGAPAGPECTYRRAFSPFVVPPASFDWITTEIDTNSNNYTILTKQKSGLKQTVLLLTQWDVSRASEHDIILFEDEGAMRVHAKNTHARTAITYAFMQWPFDDTIERIYVYGCYSLHTCMHLARLGYQQVYGVSCWDQTESFLERL